MLDDIENEGVSNESGNVTFEEVIAARMSRRDFVGGGLAAMAATSLGGGVGSLLSAVPATAAARDTQSLISFTGVPVSSADTVVVPQGYTARVLISWGDPVSDGPAFRQDASNSAADQARQWGMHNDGLIFFPMDAQEGRDTKNDDEAAREDRSSRGLLVQNHEYTDDVLLFPDGVANWNAQKTAKSLNAHGVSIVEVQKGGRNRDEITEDGDEAERSSGSGWRVVRPSRYARRITGQTPMKMGGPAAGDERLQTSADPSGRWVLGTLNNCAMGYTPWGTYLTCEENFNGYFRVNRTPTTLERRYGISAAGFGYLWHTSDSRFQVDIEPNEPNRFGWVVEIDPFKPNSTPVKRTALGRFKYEGAWVQEARDGRVVVYSGDDERNEYLYRYVSERPWRQMRNRGQNPLDRGILYVAKFNSNGSGEWLPLTPDNPALFGRTIEDILINTRGAADAVGATSMDRPEWVDTFPDDLIGILTLTNNSRRGTTPPSNNNPDGSTTADSARPPIDASNPRANNVYGHIIRWEYARDWTENTFRWDIFALGGDPAVATTGSTIVGDKYGSPDGIYVAPSGRLWIQTDVSGSTINTGAYAGFGNNQMLCADPRTRETRRFLTGPRICEITGAFVTPDERTMFVGIQHPGEHPTAVNDPANPKQFSSWPGGPTSGRPRSATIVVTKDDGGKIGE